MSSETNRQLLTIGVAFLAVVVAIVLYVAQVIDWTLIVPVIFLLLGVWFLALGSMRMGKPIKYERSPFSTIAIGLLAIAVGGAWMLFGINWLYSLIVILLVVAVLAIVAAVKHK
jgi:hypothetical protein